MQEVYTLFREAELCFLAVCEGNQPHLHPFDGFLLHRSRLYFRTGRGDPVSSRLRLNPRLALCAAGKGALLCVEGSAVLDSDRETREALNAGDDAELWYLRNCTATRRTPDEPPQTWRM